MQDIETKLHRFAFGPLTKSHDGNSVCNMYVNGKVIHDFMITKDVKTNHFTLHRYDGISNRFFILQRDNLEDAKLAWIKYHKSINHHIDIPEEIWIKRDYLETDYYLSEMKNWSGSGNDYAKLIHNGDVIDNFWVINDIARKIYVTRANVFDMRGVRLPSLEHEDMYEAMELLIEQYETFSGRK